MKIVVVIFLILGVVIFGGIFSINSTHGQKEQKDTATPVQRGQISNEDRAYSKEFEKLYSYRQGIKFSELIEKSIRLGKLNEDIGVIIKEPELAEDPDAITITTSDFLKKLSCKSDAIIVGIVKSKISQMTEDETFIYTKYEFSVTNILKKNLSSINTGHVIEITRPGGIIKLDNRRIKLEDKSYEPLEIERAYLLFLRYVKSANGYIVASPEGDFSLENNSFRNISTRSSGKELKGDNNLQNLLSNIRNIVLVGCS